jgi:hypothetical protein
MPDGQVVHRQPVYPEGLGRSAGRLAEEYYLALPTVTVSFQALARRDRASPASRPTGKDWPIETLPDGLPRSSAEVVRRAVAGAVRTHPDKTLGRLARWASALLAPRVDWRRALRVTVRLAVATGHG